MAHEINEERGEVAIALRGETYPMRPSYEAMRAIERDTRRSLQALMVSWSDAKVGLTLDELSCVVTECVRAAGRDRKNPMLSGYQKDVIAALIYETGFLSIAGSIEQLLINAMSGGAKPKADAKKGGADQAAGKTESPTAT